MRSFSTVAAATLIPAALLSGTPAYATDSPTATATSTTGAASVSTTEPTPDSTEPTSSATATPSLDPNSCDDWDQREDDVVHATTSGLPGKKINADDSWHAYEVRIQSNSKEAVKDLVVRFRWDVEVYESQFDLPTGNPEDLDVQRMDATSGTWRDLPSEAIYRLDPELAPHTPLVIQFRFRLSKNFLKADPRPDGGDATLSIKVETIRPDPDWKGGAPGCLRNNTDAVFDIYPADSGTGDATGAATGSSPSLTLLAGAGAAVLAVGTVYAVRRRRTTHT